MNRGSQDRSRRKGGKLEPSMRPRFMNRGSPCGVTRVAEANIPSMRPRFMNRGSVRLAEERLDRLRLQ